jgi:hypothetical protein
MTPNPTSNSPPVIPLPTRSLSMLPPSQLFRPSIRMQCFKLRQSDQAGGAPRDRNTLRCTNVFVSSPRSPTIRSFEPLKSMVRIPKSPRHQLVIRYRFLVPER